MGDAGPPLPTLADDNGTEQREVTVLVTGFGPFKTFAHNPSHLITTQLPPILLPSPKSQSQPIIHILLPPPQPLRVSYPTVTSTIPTLLSTYQPDYILHLGMAAGRRHYALETLAHRDGYTIKDVDNIDGLAVGSHRWLAEGCPSVLEAGWDSSDVLDRWRRELENDEYVREAARGNIEALNKIPDVRLSTDAGRFLCDFIFYESLSLRWKDARRQRGELQSLYENYPTSPPQPGIDEEEHGRSREREGKVAFLHVPGDTDSGAIERGVRVTEGAIRALVASWEGGYRRQSQERTGKVGVGFVS